MPKEATVTRIYTVSGRPVHVHTCDVPDETGVSSHLWNCDSPYCETMKVPCPEHGGPEPIVLGREPWRGR